MPAWCRPIEFESLLFKGRAVIHVANLSSAPSGLFAGHRLPCQDLLCVQSMHSNSFLRTAVWHWYSTMPQLQQLRNRSQG